MCAHVCVSPVLKQVPDPLVLCSESFVASLQPGSFNFLLKYCNYTCQDNYPEISMGRSLSHLSFCG